VSSIDAAALACGLDRADNSVIAVYGLRGGAFDIYMEMQKGILKVNRQMTIHTPAVKTSMSFWWSTF
jgi:molecular chaperone DnaK (HSP70)